METSNVKDCSWFPFSDEPLLTGHWYAPKICNPQVILPSQSCDGKWHMFAHSWLGIHHYISDSGIAWSDKKIMVVRGKYPYLYYEDQTFYLLYEKHPLTNIRKKTKEEKVSRIEIISSSDLIAWSKPTVLLDSRSVPFSGDYINRNEISHPQLIKKDDVYRLYFGASNVLLEDSKQKVSRYLGCAFARKLTDKFFLEDPKQPILESDPNDPYSNLACGSVKVVESDGKTVAFQCGSYWDEQKKKSAAALRILESEDGIIFKPINKRPVLVPTSKGWASAYIMGCDLKYKADEKCWYCYFSANNSEHGLKQKESIGLMIGSIPSNNQLSFGQTLNEILFV